MKRNDWLWVLAFPLYLVFGTVRHEGAHALSAILEGAQVTRFWVLPGWHDGQLVFGYVRYLGHISWVTVGAPYFLDLLTFALVFPLCMRVVFKRRWVWLNLVILGLVSPAVNSTYQYLKPTQWTRGDVADLYGLLPEVAVHVYFILTLAGYAVGLKAVFSQSRQVRVLHGYNRDLNYSKDQQNHD
jgi:hypothetical protein